MVAVDPKTFKLLSSVQLPELVPGRNTIAQFQGKEYIYPLGTSHLFRYEWNGKNLTLDPSWGPVSFLEKGQTPATVATPMGDWVVLMTNNMLPSNVSLSVVAISQADPTKIVRINPIPLKPLQKSFLPATLTTDLRNNRIYVWDFGAGKVAAVDFTQDGNMSVAWLQDQRTLGFMPLIGPADKRVLVGTNINPTSTLAELKDVTYTEQVLWRDAATGNILAQSDYFPAASQGVLPAPGYGGLMYDMLSNGHIMALQPTPGAGVSPELEPLVKKILSASSYSNTQTISFVNGIEVTGVNAIGDNVSVTLAKIPSQASQSNMSTPVTVIAVRVPGSSIKDLLALVEASPALKNRQNTGPLADMLGQMSGFLAGPGVSNTSETPRPIQALMELGQNTQIGVGNIVGGNWKQYEFCTPTYNFQRYWYHNS